MMNHLEHEQDLLRFTQGLIQLIQGSRCFALIVAADYLQLAP
jgi:hypothetical protein